MTPPTPIQARIATEPPNLTLVDNTCGQVCQTEHKHIYLLIKYVYGDCHENQINRHD